MKIGKLNLNLKWKFLTSSTVLIISVLNLEENNEGSPGPAKKSKMKLKRTF